jgi:hypothetical protein
MIVNYRGYEINVFRDKCLGGWEMLFYSVFSSEGEEILSGFSDTEDPVREYIKDLKTTVDDYILHPEQYTDNDMEANE